MTGLTRREFLLTGAAALLWPGCETVEQERKTQTMKKTVEKIDKWAFLDDAMTASSKKTIKELFAEDPERAKRFSLSAAGWFLDYSKNRVDRKAMKALVKLAEASDLKAEIEKMFTGKKINRTENRAVLHTALRNCDP